jgi:hypothetical protein
MTRSQRRREVREQIRRNVDAIPLPRHPYRDSAIFYGVLSAILLGVTWGTGGGLLKAVPISVGFFVLATGFSWLRFRRRLEERDREDGA